MKKMSMFLPSIILSSILMQILQYLIDWVTPVYYEPFESSQREVVYKMAK